MKVLVFGGSGLVGSKFIDLYSANFQIEAPSAHEVDILNKDQISKAVKKFHPDCVINFAAYTNVEAAESQKDDQENLCFQINVMGAENVANICEYFNKHLIHISTEYVFDGTKMNAPYIEEDQPNPINWYGQTKNLGERAVLKSKCPATIVRISMPYSSRHKEKKDIARFFLEQLKLGNQIKAVEDQRITPTLVDDIAVSLAILVQHQTLGIYHVASTDSVTPLEFAKTIAETFKLDYSLIGSKSLEDYNSNKKAKLLKYSWLNPTKFERQFGERILHTVEEALVIFKKQIDQYL